MEAARIAISSGEDSLWHTAIMSSNDVLHTCACMQCFHANSTHSCCPELLGILHALTLTYMMSHLIWHHAERLIGSIHATADTPNAFIVVIPLKTIGCITWYWMY